MPGTCWSAVIAKSLRDLSQKRSDERGDLMLASGLHMYEHTYASSLQGHTHEIHMSTHMHTHTHTYTHTPKSNKKDEQIIK